MRTRPSKSAEPRSYELPEAEAACTGPAETCTGSLPVYHSFQFSIPMEIPSV